MNIIKGDAATFQLQRLCMWSICHTSLHLLNERKDLSSPSMQKTSLIEMSTSAQLLLLHCLKNTTPRISIISALKDQIIPQAKRTWSACLSSSVVSPCILFPRNLEVETTETANHSPSPVTGSNNRIHSINKRAM